MLGACAGPPPEARLEAGLIGLIGGLRHALADPVLPAVSTLEAGERIGRALAPHADALGALAPIYRELPPRERQALRMRVSRRHARDLELVMRRAGALSWRFSGAGGKAEFRAAMRPVVAPFRARGAMWAFELFSEELVHELEEVLE